MIEIQFNPFVVVTFVEHESVFVWERIIVHIRRLLVNLNKTGLQPVSRPVELVHYFGGRVEGPSKQTERTDGGWVQSTFGAKAEQIMPQNL